MLASGQPRSGTFAFPTAHGSGVAWRELELVASGWAIAAAATELASAENSQHQQPNGSSWPTRRLRPQPDHRRNRSPTAAAAGDPRCDRHPGSGPHLFRIRPDPGDRSARPAPHRHRRRSLSDRRKRLVRTNPPASPIAMSSRRSGDNTTSSPPPSARRSSSTAPSPSPAMHSQPASQNDSIPLRPTNLLRFRQRYPNSATATLDFHGHTHALLSRCYCGVERMTLLQSAGFATQTVLLAIDRQGGSTREQREHSDHHAFFAENFLFFRNGLNFAPYWSDRGE